MSIKKEFVNPTNAKEGSTSATFAPYEAARLADETPPEPPPITR